jgi:hypothetical protein
MQRVQFSADDAVKSTVDEINSITSKIADLNKKIATASGPEEDLKTVSIRRWKADSPSWGSLALTFVRRPRILSTSAASKSRIAWNSGETLEESPELPFQQAVAIARLLLFSKLQSPV